MRILALATEAFGGFGGIAQSNRDLFRALSLSHDVVVLPRRSTQKTLTDRNIIQKKPRFNKVVYSLTALRTLRREGPFDLIFCGHLFMAPLALWLSCLGKVPFWLQIYGIEAWARPCGSLRAAAERAGLVTAISRYTRRKFLSWADFPSEKAKVLPCTYGEQFYPGAKSDALVSRYDLNGKKVLLTVGRISSSERYKGHGYVLEALVRLRNNYPNLIYLIVGDGDDRPRLERRAAELGVTGSVRFIGRVKDEELPEVCRLADVFVMPSTGEGFGIVFLEAAASGVPVIGGNADGSLDALAEGKIGRCVDPQNVAEIVEAIQESLQSPKPNPSAVQKFSRENFNHHVSSVIARRSAGDDEAISAGKIASRKKEGGQALRSQ
ncbi:MAG: glycosyltransferase family 4 protein [Candidatus Omnitrophica bacterium]|nr:glycosyltransferase family 4 protein [Candidatus Omnitrophota bacterium]